MNPVHTMCSDRLRSNAYILCAEKFATAVIVSMAVDHVGREKHIQLMEDINNAMQISMKMHTHLG